VRDPGGRGWRCGGCGWSAVGGDEVECVCFVFVGGQAVAAGGLQPGVAKQLGDDDQVGVATNESCGQGMAENMSGGLVAKCGVASDGVDDAAGGPGGQSAALGVEKQRRVVAGMGPIGPLFEPLVEFGPKFCVDSNGARFAAFAPYPQLCFAG
jgi:hypothetical protein